MARFLHPAREGFAAGGDEVSTFARLLATVIPLTLMTLIAATSHRESCSIAILGYIQRTWHVLTRSHQRLAEATVDPVGLNDTALTGPLCPSKLKSRSHFTASQIITVPSTLHEARRRPSALNATFHAAFECPFSVCISDNWQRRFR